MGYADKRSSTRFPASYKVDYIDEKDYVISISSNISVDGMYIHADNPPPPGTQLSLVFSVGELQEVYIPSIVVWVNSTGSARQRGMGVQFLTPLNATAKEHLMQMVHKITVLDSHDHLA